MIVDTVLTSRPFKPDNPIGLIMPDMANVHSRVFAAFGSEDDCNAALARPIEQRTKFTIVNPDRMAAELLKIRSDGLAYCLQMDPRHVRCGSPRLRCELQGTGLSRPGCTE